MADIIDSNHANPEEFYKSLKEKLEEQVKSHTSFVLGINKRCRMLKL